MNEFFTYFLQVNIALAVFYILFRTVFYRDTFWVGRRVYLVSAILISALYPLISLSGWLESREPIQVFIAEWTPIVMSEFIFFIEPTTETVATANPLTWQQILLIGYISVSAIFLLRFFGQLFSILIWRKRSRKAFIHNTSVRILSKNIAPFSFFNTIYLNPDSHNERELEEVLAHEKTHAQQWHSVDVLLGELLRIVCWVNPFAWLLKNEIRQNLEFLADSNVIKSGFNAKKYQYHLTELALYSPNIQITNRFNVSSLKKRITMMNRRETKKMGLVKYALVLPITLTLILWSNAEVVSSNVAAVIENVAVETSMVEQQFAEQRQTPPPPPRYHIHQRRGEPVTENSVWGIVQQMPEFPGGKEAKIQFINRNIRYPVTALENNVQGRVVVQFDVQQTGEIANVEVIRSAYPALGREVVRVINTMPDWTPGRHDGNTVIVRQTLGVVFRLNGLPTEITSEPNDIIVVGFGYASAQQSGTMEVASTESRSILVSNPLIIINGERKGRNGIDFDLSTVLPEDIYSMEILKDPLSIETYGEEAAGGVIIITMRGYIDAPRQTTARLSGSIAAISTTPGETAVTYIGRSGARPLIVINDGVKEADFDLSSISPNDIEKIEVLTGESAVELYGEEGRDGAILIILRD